MNEENEFKIKTIDFSADENRFHGKASFDAPPEIISTFCEAMAKVLNDNAATNFVEFKIRDRHSHAGYVLTLQREEGKTPAQLKGEIEEKLQTLTTSVQNLAKDAEALKELSADLSAIYVEDSVMLLEMYEKIQTLVTKIATTQSHPPGTPA